MASKIQPVGMDTATGQFKIGAPGDLLNGVPVIYGTPSLVLGSAAGIGASVSIVGSNSAGKITFTSGTSLLTSGTVLTMTFADGFAYPNGCVVLMSAGNSNFAGILQYLSSATTTSTSALSVSLGLSINTTYVGYYKVEGW